MRERNILVLELIKNPKTVNAVMAELSEHGWYCEEHLAIVTKQDVLDVLKLLLNAECTDADITNWANAVGGRTDIGFEFGPDGVVEESLYWLAHPDSPVDHGLFERIVALYERRIVKRG
ncbi:MAG: hypothetical protein ACOH1I_02370 [Gallionellaceae bacterium]